LFYALLDNLKESNSSSQENEAKSLFSNEDHYMPKRGVRVPKCNFVSINDLLCKKNIWSFMRTIKKL
jgi:hypothetical protein